jgi:hypothetical protein
LPADIKLGISGETKGCVQQLLSFHLFKTAIRGRESQRAL